MEFTRGGSLYRLKIITILYKSEILIKKCMIIFFYKIIAVHIIKIFIIFVYYIFYILLYLSASTSLNNKNVLSVKEIIYTGIFSNN